MLGLSPAVLPLLRAAASALNLIGDGVPSSFRCPERQLSHPLIPHSFGSLRSPHSFGLPFAALRTAHASTPAQPVTGTGHGYRSRELEGNALHPHPLLYIDILRSHARPAAQPSHARSVMSHATHPQTTPHIPRDYPHTTTRTPHTSPDTTHNLLPTPCPTYLTRIPLRAILVRSSIQHNPETTQKEDIY